MNKPLRAVAAALFSAALLQSALPVAAGEVYYRWIDDRGNPVHSDRPPPKGVDYEVIATGTTLKREVEADQGAVPLEVESRVGNEFEQAQEPAHKTEKNPEYCKTARNNLEQLGLKTRIRMSDDQGGFYYLDDEQREAERKKAQVAIEAYCE